jgi:hypothetical protein
MEVSIMTPEQFARERDFGAMLQIAKKMHQERLITERELQKIRHKLSEKYRPIFGCPEP